MRKQNTWLYGVTMLLLTLTACGSEVDHHGKTPLVEVDGEFLYKEDIKPSMPIGIAGKDSVEFMQNYIRNWVEDVLLYKKAESNVSDLKHIDALVQNYRKSLIMHSYQQSLIEQDLTNEFADAEVKQFYEKNKTLFKVDETMIKGLFIKVPQTANGISRIRRWYKMKDQEAIDHLEKYSLSNAVDYMYFYDRWLPATVVLAKLPQKLPNAEQYLQKNPHLELKDTSCYYFLHVDSILKRGEDMSYDAAYNEVKSVMSNMKQADFMRQVREDLYKRAAEKNDIKYYY